MQPRFSLASRRAARLATPPERVLKLVRKLIFIFSLAAVIFIQLVQLAAPSVNAHARAQDAAAQKITSLEGLDIGALIREVAANERANNKEYADYTYTSKTTERETKDGRVVKEHVTVAEVYPQYGEAVRKVLSRDGVALSAEDADKEFKRAVEGFKKSEQEAAKRRAEAAKQTPAQTPAPDPRGIVWFGPTWVFSHRTALSSGSFRLSLSDFLHAGEFTAPLLEKLHGRDAVVLYFRPRADFAPASDSQKPYAKLAGRIWIDAADKKIMRVEASPVAEALKTVAEASKKSDATTTESNEPWIVIERTRLPDGRFKESYIRLNTVADKDIFNGIARDFTEEMTDFRKFSTTGEDKVDTPKPPPSQ